MIIYSLNLSFCTKNDNFDGLISLGLLVSWAFYQIGNRLVMHPPVEVNGYQLARVSCGELKGKK